MRKGGKGAGTRVKKAAPPPTEGKKPTTPMANGPQMGELGATGLERYSGIINEEWLHQLKGVQGQRVYREMSENDPVVGAVLYAIEMLLRPVTWTCEPASDASEDQEAAEFVGSLFEDMSHTTADFVSEWMACPIYGYAPFEIVPKLRNGDNILPGLSSQFDDGRMGVRKLAIRHPQTVERWLFDEAGGIQGLVQRAAPRWDHVSIPIDRLLLFRTMMRKGNPEGMSLLRRAFVPWYRKKKLEAIEAVGIERNMAGFPLMYYPPEWLSDATYSSQLDEVKKIVQRVKADEQAGLALPMILDPNGNQLLKFELIATSGKQGTDVTPIIERYDRRIAMTILADVILLGHEKVGSFALADSKTNLFTVGLGALLDDIGAVFSRHLIPRMIRRNGLRVTKMPMLKHSDLETVDLTALGDYITKLASAGAPLFPSEEGRLERHLYRVAGLPEPEGDFPPLRLVPGGPGNEQPQEFDADGNPIPRVDTSNLPATGIDSDPEVTEEGMLMLNGAQITAAVEVLRAVATGEIADVPAVELLVAVGIARDRAMTMVSQQSKYGVPPAAPAPATPPSNEPPKPPIKDKEKRR